jgi:hypothetical protein
MSGASTVDRAQPDGVLHVQGEASRAAFMGGQVIERDTLTALVTTWRGRADLNERTGLERLRALTAGQRQCADELEAAALAVAPQSNSSRVEWFMKATVEDVVMALAEDGSLLDSIRADLVADTPGPQTCVHCGGPNPIVCNRCYGMVAYMQPWKREEGAVAPQPTTDERQSDANGQLAADPPPQPASTNEKA